MNKNHHRKSESGVILMASTMGIFIILSIFAFYLARFSVTESMTGGYYTLDIKARNLAMTGLEHGIQSYKSSRSISEINGSFNNGNYKIEFDGSNDELGSPLAHSNYIMMKSRATINDVERNLRIIISSMPEAFCFAYYGNNSGGVTFNESSGSISGDIYHNGNVSTSIVSPGIIYNSTGSGGTQLTDPPAFPTLNTTEYENLLNLAAAATSPYTNYALEFNSSSDRVNIPNHSDINLGTHTQRTVEAWFKVDDKTRSSKQTIYEEGAGVRGLNIYIHTDGTLYGGAWNEPNGESNWDGTWIPWTGAQDNTWHHVAVTLNGGSSVSSNAVKMYVDGQLINSGNGSQLWAHSGNIIIGRNGDTKFHTGDDNSAGETFYGDIDEVRIWNVERSASQIAAKKDTILSGNETGLTAYYNFQENTGIIANDTQTQSNNDGTISGATWTSGPNLVKMNNSLFSDVTINLNNYSDNILLVNSDLNISNCTINGPGYIVADGSITINSNSTVNSNIFIVCNGTIEIENSQIGTGLNSSVILYSKDDATYSGSTIYGCIISKGDELVIDGATIYGAVLNYSGSFSLQGNTNITGSVVSYHSADFVGGSVSITKGDLPLFTGYYIGIDPMVVPGSYLEY
jgi:hypothetical protein